MELGFVVAGTVDFIATIDAVGGFFQRGFEDIESFFSTEFAGSGAKGFDACYWVSLPENVNLYLDVLVDVLPVCVRRD